jgi:hypothetical protein
MNQPIDFRRIAAMALAKCAAYDPWFPNPSDAIVESWSEQIERYKLGIDDVLKGVAKMYASNGSGFRPLPKDLTDAARAVRRDRDAETGPTPEYEALCEERAEDRDELAANRQRRLNSPAIERPELKQLVAHIAGRKAADNA